MQLIVALSAAILLQFCLPVVGRAQGMDLAQLTTVLHRHAVIPRSLSGADTVVVRWTGHGFAWDRPIVRSLMPITVAEVTQSGSTLHITGHRMALHPDGSGGWTEGGPLARVDIVIEMGPASLDQIAAPMMTNVFFPGWKAALEDAPSWMGGGVVSAVSRYSAGLDVSVKGTCDCASAGQPVCAGKVPRGKISSPTLIWRLSPEIPHSTLIEHISGSVALAFVVKEDGTVADPWLLSTAGYGLDDSAAQAMLGARFFPAQCHRTPIAVPMQMTSSFAEFSYLPHR